MNSTNKKSTKPASLITELAILDAYGRKAKTPYKIQDGSNEFSCEATYIDGSRKAFEAYWTCPMILPRGGVDFYGSLGTEKQMSVKVNAAPNHLRYTSLTCWVKFPDGPRTDANQYPNATIEFDYLEIANA